MMQPFIHYSSLSRSQNACTSPEHIFQSRPVVATCRRLPQAVSAQVKQQMLAEPAVSADLSPSTVHIDVCYPTVRLQERRPVHRH